MFHLIALITIIGLCDARPAAQHATASFGVLGVDNMIIGGSDATAGDWPWQLSMEMHFETGWSHGCGASLLSTTSALSAAHCVDGVPATALRVVAGLHQRSNYTGTQKADVSTYVKHEEYKVGDVTISNDISILHLASAITVGGNVQLLTLPPNNNNDFADVTCTMTGWGRTSVEQELPDTLQEADIEVITLDECQSKMEPVANIWEKQICLYDDEKKVGSCQGDSGGPVNCPDGFGGYYVAGVTSFGITNKTSNECLQKYPSVYTRTSAYLFWIATH